MWRLAMVPVAFDFPGFRDDSGARYLDRIQDKLLVPAMLHGASLPARESTLTLHALTRD
jgi:hypothetical protein